MLNYEVHKFNTPENNSNTMISRLLLLSCCLAWILSISAQDRVDSCVGPAASRRALETARDNWRCTDDTIACTVDLADATYTQWFGFWSPPLNSVCSKNAGQAEDLIQSYADGLCQGFNLDADVNGGGVASASVGSCNSPSCFLWIFFCEFECELQCIYPDVSI